MLWKGGSLYLQLSISPPGMLPLRLSIGVGEVLGDPSGVGIALEGSPLV